MRLRVSTRCAVAALLLALTSCGGDPTPARSHVKHPPPKGCAPGELALEAGGCRGAGIPEDACADGFVPDGNAGCNAVMPADPCGVGQHAIPGESACHDVAPCADGRWGDIPVDATTQYVDGAYAGGGSDGSAQKPWSDIQSAVDAAAAGAIVAVAAGSYLGDVSASAPVHVWGRCPSMVELVGGGTLSVVELTKGADGFELHSVALTGPSMGFHVSDVGDVVLDGVWVHDTKKRGIQVDDDYGETSLILRHSLVESAAGYGVFIRGTKVGVEETTVRGTLPTATEAGVGIGAQDSKATGRRAELSVKSSIVEQNQESGIFAGGADATIEATVVRDNQPRALDKLGGRGIDLEEHIATGQRTFLQLVGSVVERNHENGIFAGGCDANVASTVVRDTLPRESDGGSGRGIGVEDDPMTGSRSTLVLSDCLIERNHDFGLYVSGSDATVTTTIVRDTQARASDQIFGRGIGVQADVGAPANLALTSSVVQASFEVGVFLAGSSANIDATLVDATAPAAADGLFGDGIVVETYLESSASAVITGSEISASARAGVSCFAATATLASTTLECNPIHLDGEMEDGIAYGFQDLGGNVCGCQGATVPCRILTSSLAPPSPVP